jgi:hypothetical protein
MAFNRLSVLLILYVAADFANPLMPGAVSYPNGSVEAVHMERSRTADVLPDASVVASFERIELVLDGGGHLGATQIGHGRREIALRMARQALSA